MRAEAHNLGAMTPWTPETERVLRNAYCAAWLVDATNDRIVWYNDHALALLGLLPETIHDPGVVEHGVDRQLTNLVSGTVDDQWTFIVDERPITVRVRAGLYLRQGRAVVLFQAPSQTRTDHEEHIVLKELNEALRSQRNFMSNVLDTTNTLVVASTRDGAIVRVNRAAEQVVGVKEEELLARPIWEAFNYPSREIIETWISGAADPDTEHEVSVSAPDGGRKLIVWTSRVMDGDYVISTGVDVTARRELQVRVQLSDRMASIGTLAAGVAHEINNPLSYVMTNVELLVQQLGELANRVDVSTSAEVAIDCLEGLHRIRDIVRNLQAFSRDKDDAIGPVSVHRVVESAINMAANEIRHRAVLVREVGRVPAVRANDSKLGQVLLNLLVNAAQAIPAGDAQSNKITVRVGRAGMSKVFIEVCDTGSGIDPENVERVFDPFFTTKPVGEGTGLGLSISHNIVRSFGGDIQVESVPGEGTVMRVVLPALAGRARTTSNAAPIPVMTTRDDEKRAKILIIDDDRGILRALRRLLKKHEVTIAHSGREAVGTLTSKEEFDLVLCDLMMPDMTGMDVYDAVKASREDLVEKIVFMTGGVFTERAREFIATVQNEILEKPIDVRNLVAMAERVAQHRTHANAN